MNSRSTNSFINMIQNNNKFDYKESKLTQIVNNSLNSKCNMFVIAHVRP